MERYDILKQVLDMLFQNKDLKSYTIHDNTGMTVCTLRFGDSDTNRDAAPERRTFKKKSKYQMERDRLRQERYTRPRTRSQVPVHQQPESDAENARSDDSYRLLGATGLSPEYVQVPSVHDIYSPVITSPCMAESSSQLSYEQHAAPSPAETSLSTGESRAHASSPVEAPCDDLFRAVVELPGVLDTVDSIISDAETDESIPSQLEPDAEERLLELCPGLKPDYDRKINRELFIEHLAHRSSELSWRDIRCGNITGRNRSCFVSFDHTLIQRCPFRLRFCGSCKTYLCTYCCENVTHCCGEVLGFIT